MPAARDLTGQTFGQWEVLTRAPNRGRHTCWICRCTCSTERAVATCDLRTGASTNCGCLRREALPASRRTHGASRSPEYRAWAQAKGRTTNLQGRDWAYYGGRGITMHPAWREDFSQFLADVGPRPSPAHTLERVDVDGNYEPGNVVWATHKRQALNRRRGPLPASGFHGVRTVTGSPGRWAAVLGRTALGTFSTPEEASAAYEAARAEALASC
jgi:hypothetical protein